MQVVASFKPRSLNSLSILAFGLYFTLSPGLRAEVMELAPSRDNLLVQVDENDPEFTVYLSNGIGEHLAVGRTLQDEFKSLRRTLIGFDFSSIPAGSLINNVELTMTMTMTRAIKPCEVSLHRVQKNWGEGQSDSNVLGGLKGIDSQSGDATWKHNSFPDEEWENSGGDFDAASSAVTSVGGNGAYTWSSTQMVSDVQNWVGGADNFGWILVGDETTPPTAKRFSSRQNVSIPDSLPKLTVDFSRTTTVTLEPLKDNTLYESTDGSLSNGLGDSLFVGRTNQAESSLRRAVMDFDLSGIPTGSTVVKASLTLTTTRDRLTASPISLHRVSTDWGEGASNATGPDIPNVAGGQGVASDPGDATWIHTFFDTDVWDSPGGDFERIASGFAAVPGLGPVHFDDVGLASDVQSWVDDPSSNFGWVLVGDEATLDSAVRFASRESGDPGNPDRPRLTLTLVSEPTPSFVRGDVDTNDKVDFNDAINLLKFIFLGEGQVTCDDASDASDDGKSDFSDAIEILKFLFLGNPQVLPPPNSCEDGGDQTEDEIGCDSFAACD